MAEGQIKVESLLGDHNFTVTPYVKLYVKYVSHCEVSSLGVLASEG